VTGHRSQGEADCSGGFVDIDVSSTQTTTLSYSSDGVVATQNSTASIVYKQGNQLDEWDIFLFTQDSLCEDIAALWFSSEQVSTTNWIDVQEGKVVKITTDTRNDQFTINRVAQAHSQEGESLEAKQMTDALADGHYGSILNGGMGDDSIRGYAGWDIICGGAGNDLIRAGNGRDMIQGGTGSDELHGDFGWNTFQSEKDGFSDLIAIKSDEYLINWIYGKAGNNPNGEKADIIEALDANDQIKIIGVFTPEISLRVGCVAHGVSGIGIYAKDSLEALYIGNDLSVAQLSAMVTGDGSAAAIANQIHSYGWTGS